MTWMSHNELCTLLVPTLNSVKYYLPKLLLVRDNSTHNNIINAIVCSTVLVVNPNHSFANILFLQNNMISIN